MPTLSDEELLEQAQSFYDRQLREKLEPDHTGELVGIDVDRQLYAVGDDPIQIRDELLAQGSTDLHVLLRVGYNWTYQRFAAS